MKRSSILLASIAVVLVVGAAVLLRNTFDGRAHEERLALGEDALEAEDAGDESDESDAHIELARAAGDETEQEIVDLGSASRAPRTAAMRVYGRLLDEDGEHGLADFEIVLDCERALLASTRTDLEGAFAFDLVDRRPLSVSMKDSAGWARVEPRVELDEAQARGEAGVVLHARSLKRAVLHGRLVDARTGEFLPRFHLRAQDATGAAVEAVTDEEGHFRAPREVRAGRVLLFAFDHPRHTRPPAPIAIDFAGSEEALPDVRVVVGPTFTLALRPTAFDRPTSFEARLAFAVGPDTRRSPWDLVRSDADRTWVRFPELERGAERALELEVRSLDGLWVGKGRANAVQGREPGIVGIDLEGRATLDVLVLDEGGAPLPRALARLALTPDQGDSAERRAETGNDGRARFTFLPAGSAVLSLATLQHVPYSTPVVLEGAHAARLDVTLSALPSAGSVRGEIRSTSGTYREAVAFELRASRSPRDGPWLRREVSWSLRDEVQVGTFDFGPLPLGTYRLSLRERDWFEWEPRDPSVTPGRDPIVIRVLDGDSVADFVLHARDSDNGASIGRLHLALDLYDGSRKEDWFRPEQRLLRGYPLGKKISWRLDVPGFVPAFGSLEAFSLESRDGERVVRTAEIDLRRGFGERYRVVSRKGKQPIANARAIVDGREVARTGSDGIAFVRLRDAPKALTFELEGWRQTGKVDLRSPERRGWKSVNTVTFDREPKTKTPTNK